MVAGESRLERKTCARVFRTRIRYGISAENERVFVSRRDSPAHRAVQSACRERKARLEGQRKRLSVVRIDIISIRNIRVLGTFIRSIGIRDPDKLASVDERRRKRYHGSVRERHRYRKLIRGVLLAAHYKRGIVVKHSVYDRAVHGVGKFARREGVRHAAVECDGYSTGQHEYPVIGSGSVRIEREGVVRHVVAVEGYPAVQ